MLVHNNLGRWVGVVVFAPMMWYAGDTGDVRHLKTMAYVLGTWELMYLIGVIEPAT